LTLAVRVDAHLELCERLVVNKCARRDDQSATGLREPNSLVCALGSSKVFELREHRLHKPVDVPALGSIVKLVAAGAGELLPDRLLDRRDRNPVAGVEDRAEDVLVMPEVSATGAVVATRHEKG
jgi:hypothetical protein